MSDAIPTPSLIKLSEQYFQQEELPWDDIASEQKLQERLQQLVIYLLDQDMERLLQVLYRIDVSEALVKEILSSHEPSQMAKNLSEVMIERMKQKLYYRNKYKQ